MKAALLILLTFITSCSLISLKHTSNHEDFLKPDVIENSVARDISSESSGLNKCLLMFKKLTGNYIDKDSLTWTNRPLSDAQVDNLLKFTKKAGRKLSEGDEVSVWDPSSLKSTVRAAGNIIQEVKMNGHFEDDLIHDSNIDSKPREVLQIRLHMRDGSIHKLKKVYGSAKSVDFGKAEWDLRVKTRENLTNVRHIEIAHTHPSYALTITSSDGQKYSRANEISSGDFAMVNDFLGRLPRGKSVSIKAIVPNGFYYESSFTKN